MLLYEKIADARSHFKDMYDAAQGHVPAVVHRASDPEMALVRVDSLKRALRALCPIEPEVRFGEGSVSIWLPGYPISAEAGDYDTAIHAFIDAMRDYAELWVEDLRHYPNHQNNWGLSNLILLSNDHELAEHAFGAG